ncbi:hypothetical protein F2Q70_00011739 [Brassica cretica]|uniref:Retrotransposon gag domain-containing protein n=1 Tax=Brassica cretica TaxID=69181 RepID=A0A8S9LR24_BRACR|nr:hypothetical protein F2Q70_00011739 [Brassica cretica]
MENPELSSEVQSLKEKLDEHFKQLEQSAEKLSQLESENLTLRDENQALNTANAETREKTKGARIYDVEDSESELEPDKEAPEEVAKTKSLMAAYLEQMFSKRLDAMQSMVERLPGVAPPIQKSNPDSYADTSVTDEITLIEMPRKFSFPSIKAYDGTIDPDDHVAQYRQRMRAVAHPNESREATMCKGFGSTLIGPALQWYINLPSRSIPSFAILSDKFVEKFASSRDLEKTSDGLYEILQHRAEPLRGYIARFNQEKVANLGGESLKEKVDEHSKQLEQSAEKLSQLESENITLRDENQALNTASNKKRRFRTQIRPMPALETPNSGGDATLPPMTSQGDAATREKTKGARIYDVEDSESEPEPDKEAPEGVAKAKSPMVSYLEQMFSKRLDAMQSMEQSAEKLSQLESENLTLRDENQALNTASNKKRHFQTLIRPMPSRETPNSGGDMTFPPMTSQGDAATREKTMGARI